MHERSLAIQCENIGTGTRWSRGGTVAVTLSEGGYTCQQNQTRESNRLIAYPSWNQRGRSHGVLLAEVFAALPRANAVQAPWNLPAH